MFLWLHDTTGGNAESTAAITPGQSWQQVMLTYVANSTGLLRIHLHYIAGAGTIYYDDVQVVALNPSGLPSFANHYKFTGQERDSETGCDFFGTRYYCNSIGRFISSDIVGGSGRNPQTLNRYSYVTNNPLRYIDPLGLEYKDPEVVVTGTSCGINSPGGPVVCDGDPQPPPVNLPSTPLNLPDFPSTMPTFDPGLPTSGSSFDDIAGQGGIGGGEGSRMTPLEATQMVFDAAGLIPGPIGMVGNIASPGISTYQGHYGQAALSLAFALPVIGQLGEDAAVGVKGFRTFEAFKKAYPAAEGMQWHHIVGQTANNIERFGPEAIHNTENLIQVPKDLHIGEGSISAYYSSKQAFTEGMTVRDWLATQSFEEQRDFGQEVLRQYEISK